MGLVATILDKRVLDYNTYIIIINRATSHFPHYIFKILVAGKNYPVFGDCNFTQMILPVTGFLSFLTSPPSMILTSATLSLGSLGHPESVKYVLGFPVQSPYYLSTVHHLSPLTWVRFLIYHWTTFTFTHFISCAVLDPTVGQTRLKDSNTGSIRFSALLQVNAGHPDLAGAYMTQVDPSWGRPNLPVPWLPHSHMRLEDLHAFLFV